jgi:predicted MPP superfamily phosphohydrolase
MKPIRLIAVAVVVMALGFGIWAFGFEPASLTTRKYDLSIPHWNAELAGLRIAVLADLHVGSPFNGISKLNEIVELTNSLNPDLIIIPGDFVIQGVLGGSFVAPEQAAAVLARLTAPMGVWACLGNHDWWLDARRVVAALEKQKIPVLEDNAVRIRRGSAHFWLVGVSDFWEGPHDVRKAMGQVTDDAPVLMFTHNPDLFPTVSSRFSLLIAGHTHGGQVHLPLLGRPIVPSKYGQRFAYGHVVESGRHMFVSPGLGTSILPVRFRVPPEVTLLELHPVKSANAAVEKDVRPRSTRPSP